MYYNAIQNNIMKNNRGVSALIKKALETRRKTILCYKQLLCPLVGAIKLAIALHSLFLRNKMVNRIRDARASYIAVISALAIRGDTRFVFVTINERTETLGSFLISSNQNK